MRPHRGVGDGNVELTVGSALGLEVGVALMLGGAETSDGGASACRIEDPNPLQSGSHVRMLEIVARNNAKPEKWTGIALRWNNRRTVVEPEIRPLVSRWLSKATVQRAGCEIAD